MAQIVIGFFNNDSEAEQAIKQLQSNNIARQDINVSYADANRNTSSTTAGADEESGISKLFKNLFGDNKEDIEKYSNTAVKSSCIVTVHAKSAEEAEMAADTLEDYGATNINNKSDEEDIYSTTPAMGTAMVTTTQSAADSG